MRRQAIERRRRLAASGPLPPALACKFTLSEQAVLRIVGDEYRDKGACTLPIDAIGARAGCCRTTVQNALRQASRLDLITVGERRRPGQPNLPNVIKVVSREWQTWLARGPRHATGKAGPREGGFRNTDPTDTEVSLQAKKRARVPVPAINRHPRGESAQAAGAVVADMQAPSNRRSRFDGP